MMEKKEIARVAHLVNKAYCEALGDFSQPEWEDAPAQVRMSALYGVELHYDKDVSPEQSHIAWMNSKLADGWTYGEVKDSVKKTHPCLVPYDQLPRDMKVKDYLFRAVVHALR